MHHINHGSVDPAGTHLICFNPSCLRRFRTPKGLSVHISQYAGCKAYVIESNLPENSNRSRLHHLAGDFVTPKSCVPTSFPSRTEHTLSNKRRPGVNLHADILMPVFTPYQAIQVRPTLSEVTTGFDFDRVDGEEGAEDSDIATLPCNSPVCTPTLDETLFNARMERAVEDQKLAQQVLQYNVEHRAIVALMQILEGSQCPDYILQQVLHWSNEYYHQGYSFSPKAYTRTANLEWMYKMLKNSSQRLPFIVSIPLEDHVRLQDVICFDFAISLLSLLQDPELMNPNNLVIDIENPLSMFVPCHNLLGEANSGQRYRDLYKDLIYGDRQQLLVPIIMYLDGTHIDSKGHIELCPVSFTCSLFTEKLRQKASAWRLWRYVPDLNRGRSNAMNASSNIASGEKGRSTRNFHAVMDVIMKGMAKAHTGEEPRLNNVPIKFGTTWWQVDIVCPLLYVINDGKQGDQLCCRFNNRSSHVKRHHRSCDCVFSELDNPDVLCNFIETKAITAICRTGTEQDLRQMSTYRVDNAFNRIDMGSNPFGIFMCTPIDVMHGLQHGVFMYALSSYREMLTAIQLSEMDRLGQRFDQECKQQSRKLFPRSDFSNGFTNLTNIECSERSGALFMFSIFMHQFNTWNEIKGQFSYPQRVLHTLECLLCFEAWLDKDTYWPLDNHAASIASHAAECAIKQLMYLVTEYLPRKEGHQWKVSKFHELKHIVRFMNTFGATKGYNSCHPEAHHKVHAKKPGRRCAKNAQTIDQQCALRVADTIVINTCAAIFNPDNTSDGSVDVVEFGHNTMVIHDNGTTSDSHGASKYVIETAIDPKSFKLQYSIVFEACISRDFELEPDLALFLLHQYHSHLDANGVGKIHLLTEYHKRDSNGEELISIRCHPNYRNRVSWHDWALFEFESENGSTQDYPCRVVCCLVDGVDEFDQPDFQLVVQSCTKKTGRTSLLFTEWFFTLQYYAVPATALIAPCFVIDSGSDKSRIQVVTDISLWSDLFSTSVHNIPP